MAKDGTYTKVDNHLFHEGRFLTSIAFRVYVTLRSFGDNDTGASIFPSYVAIKARSGLSKNKISEGLAELERFGWITRRRKFSTSNNYHVSYPTVYKIEDGERVGEAEDQTCPTELQATEWARSECERRNKKRNSQERLAALKRRRDEQLAEQILAEEDLIPF